MSRLLRGAALGAAILVTATACTEADADGTEADGATSQQDGGGYGDLYYAVYEETGQGTYTSKLLRWDGTEGGEIETVATTQDTRLFHTATVTGDGEFAVYAEGHEDGVLQFLNLKTDEKTAILDFAKLADSCLTPAFAPGDGGELLVPGGNEVTIHYPEEVEVGKVYAVPGCMPQPAMSDGDDEPSIFYLDFDGDLSSGEIMFVKPDREVVDTDLGAKAAGLIGADRLHELTVSPTGSQVCVEGYTIDRNGRDPYSRHGECQVLLDVATGEAVKYFDGATFAVKYTGEGMMLRKDGELSYYPQSDDLSEPTETIAEPEELADAQLIAVTDA